ncbi:MAG: cytochrome c peroxidase [Thiotrichaceae bacterium]
MKKSILSLSISAILLSLSACNNNDNLVATETKATLGEDLFNDISLSRDGTQACATCHDPEHAFIDARLDKPAAVGLTSGTEIGAVSVGQDDVAIGDRNTPTAAYAAFIPDFHFNSDEDLWVGGQFLDGREKDLEGQAGQPFLNPVEMQTTKGDVVAKVEAKYGDTMKSLFGADVFGSVDTAYAAVIESIAEFERTEVFSPFDSKFDRFLKGEYAFTNDELQGFALFVAENKGNCAACHPVPLAGFDKTDSIFTDHTYDNLGVPANTTVRNINGLGVDNGLFLNVAVDDEGLKGAFRVSGLRNVAVTGPYMHNGVFKDLKTAVHFYNTRDVVGAVNPETGVVWEASEVDATKNDAELGNLGLTDTEEDQIVSFLKTLTDSKFEALIP